MFLNDTVVGQIVRGEIEKIHIPQNPEDVSVRLFEVKDGDIIMEEQIQSVYRIVNGKKVNLFSFTQSIPVQSANDLQTECRIIVKRIEPDEENGVWVIHFKKVKDRKKTAQIYDMIAP